MEEERVMRIRTHLPLSLECLWSRTENRKLPYTVHYRECLVSNGKLPYLDMVPEVVGAARHLAREHLHQLAVCAADVVERRVICSKSSLP